MKLAENILFWLARRLYHTEVAHNAEMKAALGDEEALHAYRAAEVERVLRSADVMKIPIEGLDVLDLGCYDGALSAEYLRRGARKVYGVDIDAKAIDRAKSRYTDERLGFVLGDTRRIPLPDDSVDVVFSYDVFEHVAQPRAMLAELRRVLRPGGRVLIGTWGWYHHFAPHLWSVMPVPWAHVFVSEATLLRVCERVYHAAWYRPNIHDFDQEGRRLPTKYSHRSISTDYLNKFLIRDFERAFEAEGFGYKTAPVPFGSRMARWTRLLMPIPLLREFVSGYVWFTLTKPVQPASVLRGHE